MTNKQTARAGSTPGPWRWMSSSALVGDHGRRPVVITASRDRGIGAPKASA
jgi:hypothetical protein